MKKILTGIVSTGLALTLGILGVSAASGSGQNAAVTERDRDGSCVFGEAPAKTDDGKVKYRDDNGDGICDYKESVSVVCVNDSDGDGICDYREDNESPLKGSGAHCGWQENSRSARAICSSRGKVARYPFSALPRIWMRSLSKYLSYTLSPQI